MQGQLTWVNGGPGSHIPQRTKNIVNARQQGICLTIDKTVCVGTIDEYDHIINLKRSNIPRHEANHPDLIQGLCQPCHRVKTMREAEAGRIARQKRRHLPVAPHPGEG